MVGAPDGEYTFTYRLFVGGVDLGTAEATIFIGVKPPATQRRSAGGFIRRDAVKKGYLIKGRRYFLSDDELAMHIAQMLQEVSRSEVKEITAGKPKVISKRAWDDVLIATKSIADEEDEIVFAMI